MGNTYTQIHIHAVFAVQNRISLISDKWKDRLYQYMIGIFNHKEHKVLAINGMPNHIHVFFGMRPNEALSDLMKDIKSDSSRWINQNRFVFGKFSWQEGYGAFSYSKSHVPNVIEYIHNQEEHHKKRSFREEYLKMLDDFGIDYNEVYIFKDIE